MLLVAQRSLSTPVRELRRRTVSLAGEQELADGSTVALDAARLAAPMERALQACAVAMVLLATGLVLARLELVGLLLALCSAAYLTVLYLR